MAREDRQNRTKERVEVFDKEWDWHDHDRSNNWHRNDDGHFIWGVILLVIGTLFLLNSFGIVSWNVWNYIWQFWPVLLIIWGVQAILGRNPFSRFVAGLIALIVIGIVVLFSVTKVNPTYRNNLSPQINNMLNHMNNYEMRGLK